MVTEDVDASSLGAAAEALWSEEAVAWSYGAAINGTTVSIKTDDARASRGAREGIEFEEKADRDGE